MATPTTRAEFRDYCMRALGWPVIDIEIDDTQVDDRIDEALLFMRDYSFDFTERVYYKHQIIQDDIDAQQITLPDNVIGAVRIFNPTSRLTNINNLFGVQYQLALNNLYMFNSYSMIPYFMGMMHLELIDQLLVGEKPIRYTRHTNVLKVDMDWNIIKVGQYLIVEAFQVINPDTNPDIWGDRMLYKYATALIKRNWANHLKKFNNVQLTGNVQINGQQLYNEAILEIKELEEQILNGYTDYPTIMIG